MVKASIRYSRAMARFGMIVIIVFLVSSTILGTSFAKSVFALVSFCCVGLLLVARQIRERSGRLIEESTLQDKE